jgi:hemerythrin-like metal-binding protein
MRHRANRRKEVAVKGMTRITWDEKFTVHNEAIDAQHRKLFDITNHLMEVYESDSGRLLEVISELIDYLSYHFHAEHIVMKNANYPDLSQHTKEHERFTDKIQEFLKKYREDDPDLAFEMAWLRHARRNTHHWQYFVLSTETGEKLYDMSDEDVLEMVGAILSDLFQKAG